MKKLCLVVLLLIFQFGYTQTNARIILHGQVVNDSVEVENVVVFNLNSKTGAVLKQNALFAIAAKANDTLVFSSLSFVTKKVVLTEEDFKNTFIVKLKIFTTQLNDIVISRKKTSPVSSNSQKHVDGQYFDDAQSSPKNLAMQNEGLVNGVNFVRLFNDVAKLIKKKNPKKANFYKDVDFTEFVLNKVQYAFFTNTLDLNEEEVRLFLVFCENDKEAKNVAKQKTSFQLIDFLINKNKEFIEIKKGVK